MKTCMIQVNLTASTLCERPEMLVVEALEHSGLAIQGLDIVTDEGPAPRAGTDAVGVRQPTAHAVGCGLAPAPRADLFAQPLLMGGNEEARRRDSQQELKERC